MTEYIANVLTEHMFLDGLIEAQDKELYCYSIQVLIEKITGFSVLFIISIICGILWETVLFVICFSVLRKYTGGFHAKSFTGCFTGTICIYITYIKLFYPFFQDNMHINLILFFVSGIVIFAIGAVNHPNMDWNKKEYEESKLYARTAVVLELCSIMIFFYLGLAESCVLFMSFGMILCAFLLALGKLTGQEVKEA